MSVTSIRSRRCPTCASPSPKVRRKISGNFCKDTYHNEIPAGAHFRFGGWCDICGGTGSPNIEHIDHPNEVADTEQPKPTVRRDLPPIVDMVHNDLEERSQIGIRTYGTRLTAHNGRDALWDAYEEALDLAMYLRQAIEERNNP